MDSSPAPTLDTTETSASARLIAFEAHHYRVFEHARLDIHRSVTVLVGLNDVGKSTLLNAIHLYGVIAQRVGFRGPLSDPTFSGTGDAATRFVAEWIDSKGQRWIHSLILDAEAPEERLSCEERFWSWNPKTRRLATEKEAFDAKDVDRYAPLARIEAKQWQLDTEVPAAIYEPLGITHTFRTPAAYLFEPSALATRSPISMTTPSRNGFAWGNWLQDIINRRNEDIGALERDTRSLFPFFSAVSVREERIQIHREEREMSGSGVGAPRTMSAKRRARRRAAGAGVITGSASEMLDELSDMQSTREVLVDIIPSNASSERSVVRIPASEASSGLLLALSHFALLHASPEGGLLLLEEPENGLNGEVTLAMIRAVLDVVRRRSQQLVLTTHHPFWLDLVDPDSIRLLTRDADGTRVRSVAAEVRAAREKDIYASEIMGTYGPEGLLYVKERAEG